MTWVCGDCNTRWPDAVNHCTACLLADVARMETALTAIAENAESWHGPPPDMGHVRALAVIATKAHAALVTSGGSAASESEPS